MRGPAVIGAAIGGIVVVSALAVALTANRAPTTFAPNSPEAALQSYVEALEAHNLAAAYGLLSTPARLAWSRDEFEQALPGFEPASGQRRYLFGGSTGTDQRVTIRLTMEVIQVSGLSVNRYSMPAEVRMVHEAQGWRLASAVGLDLYELPAPVFPGKD